MNKQIIMYLVITIVVTLVLISIMGLLVQTNPKQTFIGSQYQCKPEDPRSFCKNTSPYCQKQPIVCGGPNDKTTCNQCIDNLEVSCQQIDTTRGGKSLGGEGWFCLPEKPEQPCDLKNGGVWTWTGWAANDTQEWECLCVFPEIAGTNGCGLNANVCKGGSWSYDATKETRGPNAATDCVCGPDHNLLVTKGLQPNVPLCIPNDPFLCGGITAVPNSAKTMCETMYSDVNFVSGGPGRQDVFGPNRDVVKTKLNMKVQSVPDGAVKNVYNCILDSFANNDISSDCDTTFGANLFQNKTQLASDCVLKNPEDCPLTALTDGCNIAENAPYCIKYIQY